jgi:hypothetical protein
VGLLIQDGYTLDFTLPARGRRPTVTGRYRPALAEAIYEYMRVRSNPRSTGKEILDATVKVLADHLVSWDAAGADGQTVPASAEHLRRVPYLALEELVNVVTGYTEEQQAADVKN